MQSGYSCQIAFLTTRTISAEDFTKRVKRWFVQKGHILAYFKNQQDSIPAGVVSLDSYILKATQDVGKERQITLERWGRSIAGKASSSLYYVLSSEVDSEPDFKSWVAALEPHCANTGVHRVFGVPIEKFCQRNLAQGRSQYKLPDVVTACIAFLDSSKFWLKTAHSPQNRTPRVYSASVPPLASSAVFDSSLILVKPFNLQTTPTYTPYLPCSSRGSVTCQIPSSPASFTLVFSKRLIVSPLLNVKLTLSQRQINIFR